MKRLDLKKNFFDVMYVNYVYQQYIVNRRDPRAKATAILLICKNASTTFREHRLMATWKVSHHLHTRQSDFQEIGILWRHPIGRWISGITEYCHRFNHDPKKIDLSQIQFDEHTVSQSDYCYELDPKKCTFFMLEDDGINKIHEQYHVFRGGPRHANNTSRELKKAAVRDIIKERLDKNLESKIKDYYKKDFYILDKYYG